MAARGLVALLRARYDDLMLISNEELDFPSTTALAVAQKWKGNTLPVTYSLNLKGSTWQTGFCWGGVALDWELLVQGGS